MRVNRDARAAAAETRRARTLARLLDSAMEVIAAKGAEGARIEDFAAAAGVSRGTFYNYFPTVDDLVHALHSRIIRVTDDDLRQLIELPVPDEAFGMATVGHYFFHSAAREPARGWVILRLDGSRAPRQQLMETRFQEAMSYAVASGRFRPVDARAARSLLFGAIRTGQRDILMGDIDLDHGVHVMALVLSALGLAPSEAEAVSRKARDMVEAYFATRARSDPGR